MSLGEQQRTAIAVAMANGPSVLLTDKPTGQVDSEAANVIFDTLHAVNQQSGVNVIIVTHDDRIAQRVPRAITIRDGYMTTEIRRRAPMAFRMRTNTSSWIAEGVCGFRRRLLTNWRSRIVSSFI